MLNKPNPIKIIKGHTKYISKIIKINNKILATTSYD